MWTGAAYAAIQFLLLCHVDGAEPKGKGLDWRFILCSQPHLWSQSVGHCKKKIIVNPIGQNVFPPQCVWALHWREGEKGTRWGGSGIWLGCQMDASFVRCSAHIPLVGGPAWKENAPGHPWKNWISGSGKECRCFPAWVISIATQMVAGQVDFRFHMRKKMNGWSCLFIRQF